MSRFVFGPAIGTVDLVVSAPAGPDAPVTKTDVAVAFISDEKTKEGMLRFNVPAYSLAECNCLLAIHAGLYAVAPDGTPPVVPADPAEVVNAALHYATSTAALQSGGVVAVDATEAPVGKYVISAVLEFDQ
jgi:hypothetical protein